MDQIDTLRYLVRLEPYQFEQTDLGYGVAITTAGDHQRGDDSQGQRNLYPDSGALAEGGLKVHGAADFFHVCFHYIHTDAAAGHVGDLFRGRESGKEDQIENFALRHASRLFGGDDGAFDSLFAEAILAQAGAIVADFDIDLSTFMKGAQDQASASLLASLEADFWKFDAMVDGIAHQMGERILDGLDDGLVEFGLFALHLDAHFLAATESDVAHGSGKLAPDVSDGLHAGLHDFFLQFGGDEVHPLRDGLEAGIFHRVGDLQELVTRQHQFADQRHQFVEHVDPDADRLGCLVARP